MCDLRVDMGDVAACLCSINEYLKENTIDFDDGSISLWDDVGIDETATKELHRDENFGDHVAAE